MHFRNAPIISVTICFITGILFQRYLELPLYLTISTSILFLTLLVGTTFLKTHKSHQWFRTGICYLLSISLGAYIFHINVQYPLQNKAHISHLSEGTIIADITAVETYSKGVKYTVSGIAQHTKDSLSLLTGKSLIYHKSPADTLSLGDTIVVQGRFHTVNTTTNPHGFDYKSYINRKGIYKQAFVSKIIAVRKDEKNSILKSIKKYRSSLLAKMKKGISDEESFSIASALLLGDKSYLSEQTRNTFANTGAMHVLAVSGLHVGIIAGVFQWILSILLPNKWRWAKLLKTALLLVVIWGFATLTGFSPSVMRSACMFSLLILAWTYKESADIFNSVFLSALILLLVNPNLLFDVGFQLSYCAVLGIIYFQPYLSQAFYIPNVLLRYAWEITSVSITATISTLPLSLFYFNYTSTVFWISNLFVILGATIILSLGLIFFILAPFGELYMLPLKAMEWSILLMNNSLKHISSIPYSMIKGIYMNPVQVFTYFIALILLGYFLFYKRGTYLLLSLASTLLVVSIGAFHYHSTLKNKEVIYFSSNKEAGFEIMENNQAIVFKNDSLEWLAKNINRYNAVEAIKADEIEIKESYLLTTFSNATILCIAKPSDLEAVPDSVHTLVMRNNVAIPDIKFHTLVLDGTNSYKQINRIKKQYPDLIDLKTGNAYIDRHQ